MLHYHYLQPVPLLINLLIPGKLLLLQHLLLNLLCQVLLLCFSRFVILQFLVELGLLDIDLEATSDLFITQQLYGYLNTLYFHIGHSRISLQSSVLISVKLELLFATKQIDPQHSCLIHELLQFFLSDVKRQARNIYKSVFLGNVPLLFLLFCLPPSLLFVLLSLYELLFSQRQFWLLILFISMHILLSLVLIIKKQLIFQLVKQQLLHLFNLLYGLFVLLNPLPFFFVVNIPFAISRLMESLFYQVLNSTLQDSQSVFVFVFDDLIIGIFHVFSLVLFLLWYFVKQMLSFSLYLQYLFG